MTMKCMDPRKLSHLEFSINKAKRLPFILQIKWTTSISDSRIQNDTKINLLKMRLNPFKSLYPTIISYFAHSGWRSLKRFCMTSRNTEYEGKTIVKTFAEISVIFDITAFTIRLEIGVSYSCSSKQTFTEFLTVSKIFPKISSISSMHLLY